MPQSRKKRLLSLTNIVITFEKKPNFIPTSILAISGHSTSYYIVYFIWHWLSLINFQRKNSKFSEIWSNPTVFLSSIGLHL